MDEHKLRNFKLLNKEKISIYINDKIFEPNLTTSLLLEGCKKKIKKNNQILDLGCGSGIISNYFFKNKLINKIYSSDISQEAVNCAIYNAKYLNADFDIRLGALIEPWRDKKFDIIINDISGISTEVSSLTKWFNSAPNESGVDGISFTLKILEKYKTHLNEQGKLIFPIIGLSNKEKIIQFMQKNSINYELLISKDWPLPNEFNVHKKLLKDLKEKNIINYNEKFDLLIVKTEIFCCS